MEAHVIDDTMPTVKGKDYEPPNGLEVKQSIIASFHKILDGEHGIFSIGRAYPRMRYEITVLIEGQGEDAQEIRIQGGDGQGKLPVLLADSISETTEPPDDFRKRAGLPVKSQPETKPESGFEQGATGKEPVKIRRGR
jgi:hypothetical protein